MDFGLVGMDGLDSMASEAETSEQGSGSGLVKEKRSGLVEDDWMNLKMARTDDFGASKAMQPKGPLFRSNSLFLDGEQQQQLLISFSTPKSGALLASNNGLERSFQSPILHYPHSSTLHARDAGLGSGSSIGSMHGGVLVGIGGSFTPSQRLEFENQALIYKYIAANVPVPHSLLMSIKRGLNPTGFSGFSSGSLGSNTAGLGPFHLSLQQHRSGAREDPEPGRCRRTDGKKWRCSRDAVADQKYCERHMRRGRHRSRKPVEGQIGHAVSSTATMNGMTLNPSPAMVVSGGSTSNGLAIAQQQLHNLRSATNTSRININGISLNKPNVGSQMLDLQSLLMPSSINLNAKNGCPTLKQQFPFEGSSQTQFGLISPDSFLNPQSSTHTVSRNVYLSPDSSDKDSLESQSHPLRHFIDDWPKHQSGCPDITWPSAEEIQSDRTRLSISMPVASSDFSSSNSSSTQEQLTLSPLKSSCELDPVEMGLGVGSFLNESTQRQANWIPTSWEASMGGPLSEVLKSTIVNPSDSMNTALDLMTEGWDACSQLDESPTGVLQKTTFGSLSSSSSGSSPIAESKIHDQISLCDNFHGSCSALIDATIPST